MAHLTSKDNVYEWYFISKGWKSYESMFPLTYPWLDQGHWKWPINGMWWCSRCNRLNWTWMIRAISRNEDEFPDALRFDPSRHLTTDRQLKDRITANHFAFGRGRCVTRIFCCFNSLTDPCRRICPGMLTIHFAKLSGRWLTYDLERSLVRRRCYVCCNNYDAFRPPLQSCQRQESKDMWNCARIHTWYLNVRVW